MGDWRGMPFESAYARRSILGLAFCEFYSHHFCMGDLDKTATNFFIKMRDNSPSPAPTQPANIPTSPWYSFISDYFKGDPSAQAVVPHQVVPKPTTEPSRPLDQSAADFFRKFQK